MIADSLLIALNLVVNIGLNQSDAVMINFGITSGERGEIRL